jgi:4-hydroxythreonine-4-phosphate dehydrogenase
MEFSKPTIALTIGDLNGIGPEIILKALSDPEIWNKAHYVLVCPQAPFEWWMQTLSIKMPLEILDTPCRYAGPSLGVFFPEETMAWTPRLGEIQHDSGCIALKSIEVATRFCLDGWVDAVVTSPIHKSSLHLAGSLYPGHTELMAHLSGTSQQKVMMLLASDKLRVGLVSIHVPLKEVAHLIRGEEVLEKIDLLRSFLLQREGIDQPRIDLLGLNPHAGDQGIMGNEEMDILAPIIEHCETKGWIVRGPFPADGYFGMKKWRDADAVLAMYHDQGLIPFKMLAFETGVNVTIGYPFIRTSPDHGTAMDIAGKNLADSGSLKHAILLAIRYSSV